MAGSITYTVVLDACVLYPASVRDILLSFAHAGLFRARWTNQIHDEWTRNLIKNRPELADKVKLTVALMNETIDDCLIENYEYVIDSLNLPDANDRHVLAAAIVGHADAIVTFNLKDFPASTAATHGIEILHPDDFLVSQFELAPLKVVTAIKKARARLKNPEMSAKELIDKYESVGLTQFSSLLRDAIHLI
ncbi:PIN domain-containing protein [Undibacterium sp. TC9W]|uniref:PIN domain-containing protein n=1 Tax=Undibacterium sp. TC9W TaxID=3413053 RepID=UPI003BF2BE81